LVGVFIRVLGGNKDIMCEVEERKETEEKKRKRKKEKKKSRSQKQNKKVNWNSRKYSEAE